MDQKNASIARVVNFGCILTGFASLLAAQFPFFDGEFLAAGVFLIAAALSFGSLAVSLTKS